MTTTRFYHEAPIRTDAGTYGTVSVIGTATLVLAANNGRTSILIQNLDTDYICVGMDSSVTTSNGIKIAAGESMEFPNWLGTVYAIANATPADVRYWSETTS